MPKIRSTGGGYLPLVTSYNGVATAGNGLGAIVGYGSANGVSADGTTIASFTASTGGVFEVGGWFRVTAWTSGAVAAQISYTDCNGGTITGIKLFGHNLTAGSWVNSLSATGPMQLGTVGICVQAGSTITIKTSFAGTATASFDAFIRQVG